MNVLLTGGTGYIASHTAIVLAHAGHRVVLLDNLANSNAEVVHRIEQLVSGRITFVRADIRDRESLSTVLHKQAIDAVFHFAGSKAVGESGVLPLDYYDNNVGGTLSLLASMRACGTRTLIFSSSATVYGQPRYLPIDELHPIQPTNPYGRTKRHIEEILIDLCAADNDWRVICLRYFNPAGAHPSGQVGENPRDQPSNLMPMVAQVASGRQPILEIFGNDYETPDGTGVRDYIHVMDLAEGHAAALEYASTCPGFHLFNLGTGRGHGVMEIVQAYEAICGRVIPRSFGPRRTGDVPACYADATRAERELGWKATRTLREMCESSWAYEQSLGYDSSHYRSV